MGITIGRVSLDDIDGWQFDADTITITTDIIGASLAAAKAKRAQVLGLMANPDEPVVPVTFSEDSDVDGYYTVLEASVGSYPSSLVTFTFPASIVLQRVPDFASPLFENICMGGFRSNNQGITAASMQAVLAVPVEADSFYDIDNSFNDLGAGAVRSASNAPLNLWLYKFDAGGPQRRTVQFSTRPAYWYYGACTIEEQRSGSWYTLVGRQWMNARQGNGWRISNGIIRVSANGTEPRIDVEMWTGAAWSTAKTYKLGRDSTFAEFTGNSSMHVLRNGPEEVAIRLVVGAPLIPNHTTIDLRIRRGQKMVEGYVTDMSGQTDLLGAIGRATNEASSDMTVHAQVFGVIATAADADALKYMIFSPRTITRENTIGRINLTTPNSTFPFAISGEFTGAADPDTYDDIVDQYLAGYTERYSLAGR